MREGIPLSHPLLNKLWQVSKIRGDYNPFAPDLLELNHIQVDFILEKYVEENPTIGTFYRIGSSEPIKPVAEAISWERVLIGRDRERMFASRMPSQAVMEKLATLDRYSKPTIRKSKNAAD